MRDFVRGTAIVLAGIGAILLSGFQAPRTSQAPVKVLLIYDLEGASGVLSAAGMDPQLPDSFARGQASLVEDVNRVVAGLFDAGASGVDVFNSHGYGGDSLVPRAALDRRARIISRPTPNFAYNPSSGLPDSGYQAVVAVAMHDRPRSGGFSPHTLGAGLTPVLAGRGLTETELVGYNFGARNVPVIFASGDDRLQQTLADAMPWVEYVVVKRVTSPTRVAALPSGSAGRELQAGARRALERLTAGKTRPMSLAAPIRAGLIATYPAFLPPALGNLPGIERRGDTVLFSAPDLTSAWRGVGALVVLASRNFPGLTMELMRGNPEWSGAARAAGDSVWARAGAFERGEWKP